MCIKPLLPSYLFVVHSSLSQSRPPWCCLALFEREGCSPVEKKKQTVKKNSPISIVPVQYSDAPQGGAQSAKLFWVILAKQSSTAVQFWLLHYVSISRILFFYLMMQVSTGLRSQWIIFSLCSICRHLRSAWAKRRIRARLKPWKLFFFMSSYKFTLDEGRTCDVWLFHQDDDT